MGSSPPQTEELTQSTHTPALVKLASREEMRGKTEGELQWQQCDVRLLGKRLTLTSAHFPEVCWTVDETLEIVTENLPEHIVGLRCERDSVVYAKLKFDSVHVFCQWVSDFQKARRPVWDAGSIDTCKRCSRRFTFFRRVHHCRNCGAAICSRCSSYQATLPHMGYSAAQRVCAKCSSALKEIVVTEIKKRMAESLICSRKNEQIWRPLSQATSPAVSPW